jgi:hypothetical protein
MRQAALAATAVTVVRSVTAGMVAQVVLQWQLARGSQRQAGAAVLVAPGLTAALVAQVALDR